ncbi:MAG TPA: TIM barrel protein [Methylomirabilota bacterium]|nr:TIM barrel protein [Methylomirabilota bacterium]
MTVTAPHLLLCHVAIGRDVAAVREYVTRHRYAGVEWGLDSLRVAVARDRRQRTLDGFRSVGGLVSLHAPYTDLELGHRDAEYAAAALRILREYVEVAADLAAHHLNLHVGSHALAPEECAWDTLLRNLTALLDHAARRRVLLTVENLRLGLTSDPETFARLLRATGAPACFDVGHAHGSDWVQQGRGSVVDVLRSIPTRVAAAHVYFTETGDTHHPPREAGDLATTLDALIAAGCDWWVVELHTRESLEQTRRVLDDYLGQRATSGVQHAAS